MAYFPLFWDMTDKKVLLVGGGNIAVEKLEKLLDFTRNITVIAASTNEKMDAAVRQAGLRLINRAYRTGDIEGFDLVIVATDTPQVQRQIFEESRGKGILVNTVDDPRYCDVIFPSYIKRDDLTIAFSTGGVSPALAKALRVYVEGLLPEGIGAFLEELKRLRTTLPKGKKRMRFLSQKVQAFFDAK